MNTPTPQDHDAAKRAVDLAQLNAAPWQLEHLAVAIADARTEGRRASTRRAVDILRERQHAVLREALDAAIAVRVALARSRFSAAATEADRAYQWELRADSLTRAADAIADAPEGEL